MCAVEDGEYLAERYRERLPAADIGRSCVRFKRLADVDEEVLRELVGDAARLYAADPTGPSRSDAARRAQAAGSSLSASGPSDPAGRSAGSPKPATRTPSNRTGRGGA